MPDQCIVYANLPGRRASDSPQATISPSLLITSYRPDVVIHNRRSNSIAILELTCPLDSVCHLDAARDRKLGKEDYQLLLLELDRLDIVSFYDIIEVSVLGHYLPTSLSAFWNCVNFILLCPNLTVKKTFDSAAVVSISSSRRIFMAKDCQEWCVDT